MKKTALVLAVLLTASMAMAANATFTFTVTKAAPSHNANGTPIISATDNIWEVVVTAHDLSGTQGAWATDIQTSMVTAGTTIHQMVAFPGVSDTVVDTQLNAENYDAPTHPTVTNRKNDGYDMHGDTYMATGWQLIGGGEFTAPQFDTETGALLQVNQWNLHAGTLPGVYWGDCVLGHWAIDLGTQTTYGMHIWGTLSRGGVDNVIDMVIPEPASMSLLALAGIGLLRRRQR